MSLKQTQWAWQLTLKPGPKLVLLALSDYANDQGNCYPSLKQLQKKCSIARSTLLSHLRWLRENKFISIINQHDKNGFRRNNFYSLHYLQSPEFKGQSPNFGPTKVQNSDGNNINHHINRHKNQYDPESGPRFNSKNTKKKPALEGAI